MYKIAEAKAAMSDPMDRSEMVVAKVPQGYETKINIRLVPGRDIRFNPDVLRCQPRQGTLRRDPGAFPGRGERRAISCATRRGHD